jgi:hypothetical protein
MRVECMSVSEERSYGLLEFISPVQWVSEFIPQELSGRGVKLTAHLHLVWSSKIVELYLHSPIRLHGTFTYFYFNTTWFSNPLQN